GKRFAYTHRMGAHQVHLQLAVLGGINADVAQLSHTGGHGIGQAVFMDELVDYFTGSRDFVPRGLSDSYCTAMIDDLPQVFQSEIVAVNQEGCHRCWSAEAWANAARYFCGSRVILNFSSTMK